jgi:hypothetical protein
MIRGWLRLLCSQLQALQLAWTGTHIAEVQGHSTCVFCMLCWLSAFGPELVGGQMGDSLWPGGTV